MSSETENATDEVEANEVSGEISGGVSVDEAVEETVAAADEAKDVTDEAAEDEAAEEEEAANETAGESDLGPGKRALAWCARRWVSLLLAVALVASAGGAGGVYWWMYRPDQQTKPAVEQQVADAAKEGTVALLSYAPDTLDEDLTVAKSHLTGEFLKYYTQFTDDIVKPAASKKGVKTEATAVRAAVSEMHPDRAVVLVFVNQVTTSKDRPEPALATSAVMVTMVNESDHWKISEFKPV